MTLDTNAIGRGTMPEMMKGYSRCLSTCMYIGDHHHCHIPLIVLTMLVRHGSERKKF